jgi:hypothetical protein
MANEEKNKPTKIGLLIREMVGKKEYKTEIDAMDFEIKSETPITDFDVQIIEAIETYYHTTANIYIKSQDLAKIIGESETQKMWESLLRLANCDIVKTNNLKDSLMKTYYSLFPYIAILSTEKDTKYEIKLSELHYYDLFMGMGIRR